MSIFPRFNKLPLELRRRIWFFALPGPRIVYVQRPLTSGRDAYEEEESTSGNDPPSPSYFISPSSSNQIITLLWTCKESHSIVKENYTLLIPASSSRFSSPRFSSPRFSSTWFSFSADFLYLDFGFEPHTLYYDPRHFTSSIPDPWYAARVYSRYPRPKFNPELLKRVKNLVITIGNRFLADRTTIAELVVVFTGVKVLVLADRLFSTCHEYSEELVWLRGELGDEISSITQLNADPSKLWHEPETEEAYRHLLTNLPLWRLPVNYMVLKDEDVYHDLQNWIRLKIGEMPIVIRRSIVTTKAKDMLIDICGSEDNFQAFSGLDFEYIEGQHKYSGSLDLYQQLSFLELMLARLSADFDTRCIQGCSIDEMGEGVEEDMLFLLHRIDMLVLEIK